MATGKKGHLDAVREIVHSSDILKVEPVAFDQYLKTGQPDMGSTGWTWGYNCIALGKYLLTKDEAVISALRTCARGLARGQYAIGLWGHRMAAEARKGRAAGYGIMNAASIPNFVGLLNARKCGIKDPIPDQAIDTTYAYVADQVEKGGFPYGVHGPASMGIRRSLVTEYLVKKLVSTGHKRIALIVREERRKPHPGLPERQFLEQLQAHGITTGPSNIPDWDESPEGLMQCLDRLFAYTPPSALLVGDPAIFHAVQTYLARKGLNAPKDVHSSATITTHVSIGVDPPSPTSSGTTDPPFGGFCNGLRTSPKAWKTEKRASPMPYRWTAAPSGLLQHLIKIWQHQRA